MNSKTLYIIALRHWPGFRSFVASVRDLEMSKYRHIEEKMRRQKKAKFFPSKIGELLKKMKKVKKII